MSGDAAGSASVPLRRRDVACLLRTVRGNTKVSEDALHRIADLLDPTCHAEVVAEDTTMGLTARYVKCSECHTVWREPSRVRYCPNCGCRRTFETEED